MTSTSRRHTRTQRGVDAYRTALFAVLAVIVAGIAMSMPGAAHAAPATPTTTVYHHQQHTAADPAPLIIERLEEIYPYRNDTEEYWAILDCRSDASTYLQQGALGWQCKNNTFYPRVELWIQWREGGCPGCRLGEAS